MAGGSSQTSRTWPIVEAALGSPGRIFKSKWAPLLCEPVLWNDIIPQKPMTRKVRALAFRMLSRSECL
eukprot:7935318-Pyramimonas_sp.AAC.1